MFKENNNFEKFESKVWLSSPTMHGPEIEYVKEAYETNWMSTVGKISTKLKEWHVNILMQTCSCIICRNSIIASCYEISWY